MPAFEKRFLLFFCLLSWALLSCHNVEKKENAESAPAGTPVTLTNISSEPLTEFVELTATSTYLQKSYVKSIATGYIKTVNVQPGKLVSNGQTLFSLQTKEAQSIGNAVNKLDPSFKFSGLISVKSSGSGYVTQLNHQVGDYVQDGEQLAVINDVNSIAFLLSLPYELKLYLKLNTNLELLLPDGTKLSGTVASAMPSVDPTSQVQGIVIKVANSTDIPENLIAKVKIIKVSRTSAASLPKQALLTNDVQSEYWVMKMIDSNTAAKVPVKKGIETKDRVEILEPQFAASDKIVLSGNYGLPDTAKVQIAK